MRLGRIILASLTALVAYSYANGGPASIHPSAPDSFPRLLQAVAPLLAAAGDLSSATQNYETNPSAILPLKALSSTLFGSSLVLLASFIAIDLYARRHQRTLLRL
jgi:hypothetical protein